MDPRIAKVVLVRNLFPGAVKHFAEAQLAFVNHVRIKLRRPPVARPVLLVELVEVCILPSESNLQHRVQLFHRQSWINHQSSPHLRLGIN